MSAAARSRALAARVEHGHARLGATPKKCAVAASGQESGLRGAPPRRATGHAVGRCRHMPRMSPQEKHHSSTTRARTAPVSTGCAFSNRRKRCSAPMLMSRRSASHIGISTMRASRWPAARERSKCRRESSRIPVYQQVLGAGNASRRRPVSSMIRFEDSMPRDRCAAPTRHGTRLTTRVRDDALASNIAQPCRRLHGLNRCSRWSTKWPWRGQ